MSDREGTTHMVPELEASAMQLPPPGRTEAVRGPSAAPAAAHGAAPTASAAPGLPGLSALLVPADYVDVPSLLRMHDRRQRQALIDALFRGCDLCYRA